MLSLSTRDAFLGQKYSGKPLKPKELIFGIHGLGDAIGIEDKQITWVYKNLLLFQFNIFKNTQDPALGSEFVDFSGGAVDPQRPVMAGIGVGQPTRAEVQSGIKSGQE